MELVRIAEKGGDELSYASFRIRVISRQIKGLVNQPLRSVVSTQEVAHA